MGSGPVAGDALSRRAQPTAVLVESVRESSPPRRWGLGLDASIALVPILGLGLVMLDQVGRYLFYGIPLEFLEIDAYKLITSSLTVLFTATSTAIFATSLVGNDPAPEHRVGRIVYHLALGASLTVPLWITTLDWKQSIAWPTIALIGLAATATWVSQNALKRRRASMGWSEHLGGWSLASFLILLGVCLMTVQNGYSGEASKTQFAFVAGTQRAIVGRMGDTLIAKEFNPTARAFVPGRVILISTEDATVLELRSVKPKASTTNAAALHR